MSELMEVQDHSCMASGRFNFKNSFHLIPHTYLQWSRTNENHETSLRPIKDSQKKPKVDDTQQSLCNRSLTQPHADLKTRDRIFDEFLEPAEGQEVGEAFEGGDEAIITVVKQEMAEKAGQVIGVEFDEEDDPQLEVSRAEMLALCQWLEGGSLQFGNADSTVPLDVVKQIRLLRAYLRREELLHGMQTTIDSYFR
ncbi:hypothetical protein K503DRAFT_859583 [Rhizopogon vinicolor AM-OR11-026]|uniref:Uncharacterized protein n=1 Tax=Rhizopogon vinicolor AM-OR11-026 TaxID=1314800 RepID=A0A1B7MMF4_9AGAM|nr:hypothetical protein K503DRAFT_859583 [Rhizopogon vinicolor AM-OR11-026]